MARGSAGESVATGARFGGLGGPLQDRIKAMLPPTARIRRKPAAYRVLAVLLTVGVFLILAMPALFERWGDATSLYEAAAQLLVLLTPFLSFGALVLIARRLAKKALLSRERRRHYHVRFAFLGPIGCLWIIWDLTRR